jgi:hypothetical protein
MNCTEFSVMALLSLQALILMDKSLKSPDTNYTDFSVMALFSLSRLISISPDTSYTDFSVMALFCLSRIISISPETNCTDFSVMAMFCLSKEMPDNRINVGNRRFLLKSFKSLFNNIYGIWRFMK